MIRSVVKDFFKPFPAAMKIGEMEVSASPQVVKRNPSVAVIRRLEYEYYFRNNNSDYILTSLKDSESCYVLLVEEETLSSSTEIQDFIHFLQTELQKNI